MPLMQKYLYVNVRASLIKESMPEAITEEKWWHVLNLYKQKAIRGCLIICLTEHMFTYWCLRNLKASTAFVTNSNPIFVFNHF